MNRTSIIPALALIAAGAAQAALPVLYEEALAREEEKLIFTSPIAGIENNLWFEYRIEVIDAQKDFSGELRDADDVGDRREAWEDYADELRDERLHYIEEMAERGYRDGRVLVAD